MRSPFARLDSRTLLRIGMSCLLLFFSLNVLLRRWVSEPWKSVLDGSSGVALGAAIAFILLAARTKGRRLRGVEADPCE